MLSRFWSFIKALFRSSWVLFVTMIVMAIIYNIASDFGGNKMSETFSTVFGILIICYVGAVIMNSCAYYASENEASGFFLMILFFIGFVIMLIGGIGGFAATTELYEKAAGKYDFWQGLMFTLGFAALPFTGWNFYFDYKAIGERDERDYHSDILVFVICAVASFFLMLLMGSAAWLAKFIFIAGSIVPLVLSLIARIKGGSAFL